MPYKEKISTITVPLSTKEKLEELKRHKDESWNSLFNSLMEFIEAYDN